MPKLPKPSNDVKVVDTQGQDLGPSREFMLEDLKRSGLTEKDMRVQPLPLEADGTRSYKIFYPREVAWRVRRDAPKPKYLGAPGVTDVYLVDVAHFDLIQRAKGVLHVVEGEKKAAAFWRYLRLNVVGIGGCSNYRSHDLEPDEMLPELAVLVKASTRVVLVLDGDIVDNDDVARAARQFHACCEKLGVACEIVQLPKSKLLEGRRVGLDDWIVEQPGASATVLRKRFGELARIEAKTLPESRKLLAHRLKLSMRKSGDMELVAPTYENAVRLVRDHLQGRASCDEFLGDIIDGVPFKDGHDVDLQTHIERTLGASNPWPIELTRTARRTVMERTTSNLLADWLRGLQWDGKPRIASMFRRMFGASEHSDAYLSDAARAFLVGMCRRATVSGSKFDLMLILQGPQGIGKTIAFEALAGALLDRRLVSTADLGTDPNELARIMEENWIVSFDEMAGHSKRDDAALKNLLTKTELIRNEKYKEKVKRSYVHCVFAGTTNEWQPLRDATGNRRFLIVRCGRIDIAGIVKERPQLFAEAMRLLATVPDWWVVRGAAEEQEAARLAHPWEDKLDQYLSEGAMMRGAKGSTFAGRRLTTAHALANAVRASVSGDTRPVELNAQMLAKAVFARGWKKVRVRRGALDFCSTQASLFYPPGAAGDGSLDVIVPELSWVYVDPK